MGEYADMAVDDALNGHWDADYDDDDDYDGGGGWFGRSRRRRRKRTNQTVFHRFKNYKPSLEEAGF